MSRVDFCSHLNLSVSSTAVFLMAYKPQKAGKFEGFFLYASAEFYHIALTLFY